MPQKFHQRFCIEVGLDEAKRRFVNRANNMICTNLYPAGSLILRAPAQELEKFICQKLGERWNGYGSLPRHLGDDFNTHLRALEAYYEGTNLKHIIDSQIRDALNDAELDLGIKWEQGKFIDTGAPVLDDKLINDVLGLLQTPEHKGVDQAFRHGLDHFLHSAQKHNLLSDVVNRMYEALEALAKVVCRNDKDLSANRESLVSKLNLSDYYKQSLKLYIEYANDLHRHAAEKGQQKPNPSRREVEAFMYLTGLFIRLALSKQS